MDSKVSTICGKEFVLVERKPSTTVSSNADDKTENDVVAKRLAALKSFAQQRGFGGIKKPFKVKLVSAYQGTGSANTAYFPVVALNFTNAVEYSGWAGLFDEVRCHGIEVSMRWQVNTTSSVPSRWAMAFDPQNSAPYTTVAGVYEAAQYMDGVLGQGQLNAFPGMVTRNGLWVKKFKLPQGKDPVTNLTNTSVIGANWTDTSNIVASVGYLKMAINALGTSSAATYDIVVTFHLEFRSRT